MLQFLKKLKLCSELVPEIVLYIHPSKFICNHHYYNQLIFTAGISHRTTSSSVKSVTLSQNLPDTYDMSDLFFLSSGCNI